MPILAIDTATDICAIAVGDAGTSIAAIEFEAGRSHLELLLPRLQRLLDESCISQVDIDGVVAGTGPGAFSGLRVGIATARGIAQALGVPLAGFSTLRALAMGILGEPPPDVRPESGDTPPDIMPIIDARRGQVFAQVFRDPGSGRLQEVSQIICLSPESLIDGLDKFTDRSVLAAGNGILAHHTVFAASGRIRTLALEDPRHRVSARYHLTGAGQETAGMSNIINVAPVYAREPDADKTVLSRKREPWLS